MSTATTAAATELVVIRDRTEFQRQIKLIVVFAIVAALCVLFWATTSDPNITYAVGEKISRDNPAKDLDGGPWLLVCMVLSLAALVLSVVLAVVNKVLHGVLAGLLYAVVGLSFLISFLIWNYADQTGVFQAALTNPLPETIRQATPLILGALAGCLCERSGVINIAIEGQFLTAAFFASVAASLFYSAEMGLVGGVLAGVGIAAMLAWFALKFDVNQVVLGVVLTAFATGLTAFLLSQIPDDQDVKKYLNEPPILQPIDIPGLSSLPVVGQALFDQSLLVYLMYLSVAVVTFSLFQTKWGLRVRAVGEHPKAADTVGIKVLRVRWQAVLFGGVFAGLGGAFYTVGSTGSFDNNASSGNGFIALAAVIMGRWHPIGATFAALFFGFMWSLQVQLAFVDKIPGELLRASPYLATIIAVAGFVGRVRPPAADGEPYVKG